MSVSSDSGVLASYIIIRYGTVCTDLVPDLRSADVRLAYFVCGSLKSLVRSESLNAEKYTVTVLSAIPPFPANLDLA